MTRKSPKKTANIQQLLKDASKLSDADLRSLISGLEIVLRERDSDSSDTNGAERDEYGRPLNQQGYIELKYIRGCGPYRYLRYWDGRKHRSVYLGKEE
ncbi:hypothetical protein [Acaryochloris thomasi]|nr:hypothetical protein [Acaryochloris thomasi]